MVAVRMLNALAEKLPLKKMIVFESSPDYACNTYPVFSQLRRELPEYKMIWWTSRNTPRQEGVDGVYHYDSEAFFNRVKRWYYTHFASAFVYSNRMMEKTRPEQLSLFLCHGSKTKKTRGYYTVDDTTDYINVQSHFFDDIITYEYNCGSSQLVYLGYPRCDSFFKTDGRQMKRKLGLPDGSRYLVWLPTFRKNPNIQNGQSMDTSKYGSIGMPLVYSREDLARLDMALGTRNMVIWFKPHPAQDISGLICADTRNIRILRDRDLAEMGVPLYDLLAGSDGMITDYSSVFFDYLLADKPIATTTDDMEEWKQMTGFAFDLDAFLEEATTRTATLEGLLEFLDSLCVGRDTRAEGRRRIRELTNTYFDGDSAKRVAAFIKEKIGA